MVIIWVPATSEAGKTSRDSSGMIIYKIEDFDGGLIEIFYKTFGLSRGVNIRT